jgi:hypothetical protein
MSTVLKSLLAAAASLMAQAAFAQTTTYQYAGNPFQYFSCGPSVPGPGTLGCFNQPAPNNHLTSYIATDHVTATLSFSAPLPANLPYGDVRSLAGFTLSMSDGHQILVSSPTQPPYVTAMVSTDGSGQIANWNLTINAGNVADSSITSLNPPPPPPPQSSFTLDSGILVCCDPLRSGNLANEINHPGTWTVGGGSVNTMSYGGFTRVIQFDAYDHDDFVAGDFNFPRIVTGTGSQLGMNYARTSYKPVTLTTPGGPVILNLGPSVGAWSNSNQGSGSGRGLALATFTAPPGGMTFRVNGVFTGEFEHDWFGLPDGFLSAGAEILIVDTDALTAAIAASHLSPARFFMGNDTVNGGISPQTAFANLQTALRHALLATPTTFYPVPSPANFDVIRGYGIKTPMVTVAAGKQITIIFDAVAYSFEGGFPQVAIGTGVVDFYSTLQPDSTFLSDEDGNPIQVLPPTGSTPAADPTPSNLALTEAQSSALIGTSANFTATVTDASSAPLSGVFVTFLVTGGPDAGLTGAGQTDANGHATFTYTGTQGAGTDTVQASIGPLTSNLVQEAWTSSPLTSGSTCNGTFNGTFTGNLTISNGQNCVLLGGQVTGNILVTGGSLSLSRFHVGGNLLVQGGGISTGPLVTVGGSLQLQNLPASAAASHVCNTVVQGNVQAQGNASAVQIGGDLSCPGNTISGNLLVQDNTGSTQVSSNSVQKNLNCSGNAALSGSGNTASQKQGQCAAF